MYTVVRFVNDQDAESNLTLIGQKINSVSPGTFTGLDRVDGRFSISVCSTAIWEDHVVAMVGFLQKHADTIKVAIAANMYIEFDVAIEPEDYNDISYLSVGINPYLANSLSSNGVHLTLSYYTKT